MFSLTYLLISLSTIVALLKSFVASQPVAVGFLIPDLGTLDVLSKDRPVIGLANIAVGPKLTFKLVSTTGFNESEIQHTFRDFESPKPLDGSPQNCKSHIYITSTKYAFLCDNKYLLFSEFDAVTGSLLNSTSLEIPVQAGSTCTGLEISGDRFDLFFTCILPVNPDDGTRTIKVYQVDSVLGIIQDTGVSKEDNDQGIFTNLMINSFNTRIQSRKESLLFIYEKKESPIVKLHLFKSNKNQKLVDGGFFTSGANITGIIPGDGFLQIITINQTLFFVMRNATTLDLYLQKCLPGPVYGKINCLDVRISLGCKYTNLVFDTHRPLEPQRDPSYRFVLTTAKGLRFYSVDATREVPTVSLIREVTETGSSIASVSNTFVWGDKIYATGTTQDGKPVILLYRGLQNNYEEKIFEAGTKYDISFVRQGITNPAIDYHTAIGEKQLWSSAIQQPQVMPIMPDSLKPYTSNYTVECYSGGQYVNKLQFRLSVMPKITSNTTFAAKPTLESYAGSDLISAPLARAEFRGNAPEFRVTFNDSASLKLAGINYINQVTDFDLQDLTGVKKVFFIGQDLFVVSTFGKILIVQCTTNSTFRSVGKTSGKCEVKHTEDVDNKQYLLDAGVLGEYVLILLSNSSVGNPDKADAVVLRITNLEKVIYSYTYDGYSARVGVVESKGGEFSCFIAGSRPESFLTQRLMNLKASIGNPISKDWTNVMTLPSHICPTEMQYSQSGKLTIPSSCGDKDTSKIYTYNIVEYDFPKSFLAFSYSDLGTNSLQICPTETELGVMDLQNNKVFSFNIAGSQDYRIYYPLSEYKLDTIIDYHCDQKQNVFQVLAYSTENQYTKLVTYRAESQFRPFLRVHSVFSVPDTVKHIASSYNLDRDVVTTLLLANTVNNSTESKVMLEIFLGAPYFYFQSTTTKEAWVNITYSGNFRTASIGDSSSLSFSQILHLVPSTTSLQVSASSPRPSLPSDGQVVTLDYFISTHGPTRKITVGEETKGVKLIDRFSESSQFRDVETLFDMVTMDKMFVFGSQKAKPFLLLFGDGKVPIAEKEIGKCLRVGRAGDGTAFYALTLSKPEEGRRNKIIAFVLTGEKWETYQFTFQQDEFVDMRFYKVNNVSFGYVGIRGDVNEIQTGILEMSDGNLREQYSSSIRVSDSVNSFEVVHLAKINHLAIFANLHQSINAEIHIFKINAAKSQIIYVATDILQLVPGVDEIPDYNPLSCVQSWKGDSVVDCIHTGYDQYSYLVSYTFDPTVQQGSKMVTAVKFASLRNIVNYTPKSVTTAQNYTAISVSHTSDGSQADLILIYAMHIQDFPFRILTNEDFGTTKTSFRYLSPCFFEQQIGTGSKLGINLAEQNASIRVYNIDLLKMLVTNSSQLKTDDRIYFHSLSGEKSSLTIGDIFFWKQNDPSGKTETKRSSRWIVYVISGVVLLGALIALGIFWRSREADIASKEQGESLFDTRVEGENTIRAEEYSRTGN